MQVKYTALLKNDRATLDRYQNFQIADITPPSMQQAVTASGKVQEMQDLIGVVRNLRPGKKNFI